MAAGYWAYCPRGQQALSARPRLEAGLALRVAECTRVSMRLYGHSIFVVIFWGGVFELSS